MSRMAKTMTMNLSHSRLSYEPNEILKGGCNTWASTKKGSSSRINVAAMEETRFIM
jgi:hypothetical protein